MPTRVSVSLGPQLTLAGDEDACSIALDIVYDFSNFLQRSDTHSHSPQILATHIKVCRLYHDYRLFVLFTIDSRLPFPSAFLSRPTSTCPMVLRRPLPRFEHSQISVSLVVSINRFLRLPRCCF
jgi:hypothetical protein